jgi:hypothetical protein
VSIDRLRIQSTLSVDNLNMEPTNSVDDRDHLLTMEQPVLSQDLRDAENQSAQELYYKNQRQEPTMLVNNIENTERKIIKRKNAASINDLRSEGLGFNKRNGVGELRGVKK